MSAKLLCALVLFITVTSSNAVGINGGVLSSFTTHPYYASIQSKAGARICGGVLIKNNAVATAASCIADFDTTQMVVRTGSGIIPVIASTFNVNYDLATNANNVGLLKLAKPIVPSQTVNFIPLATAQPATGVAGVVVGFDASSKLVEFAVSLISSDDCNSGKFGHGKGDIKKSEFCASVKANGCDSELGNPLVSNKQLIGLTSWSNACAKEPLKTVYTNIPTLNGWITNTLKGW